MRHTCVDDKGASKVHIKMGKSRFGQTACKTVTSVRTAIYFAAKRKRDRERMRLQGGVQDTGYTAFFRKREVHILRFQRCPQMFEMYSYDKPSRVPTAAQ